MHTRTAGGSAMKIDMRHRPSPLSAGEAIEYDHAARAVAQLLFPGDPAKIQDTIEKGMGHPPDVQREVIAEYKRRGHKWGGASSLPGHSASSKLDVKDPSRLLKVTVVALVALFSMGGMIHLAGSAPRMQARISAMSALLPLPLNLHGPQTPSPLPSTAGTVAKIDPASARRPSNVKVAYSFGSGLMECLAPGDTNLASRKQRKDYSKENSTEAPVTAVFGRGTWNADHLRLVPFGVNTEIVNWDNTRQLNRVSAIGMDIAIMHKADEFWMMNKIRERGIFPVAIPSPVAFEVFDDKIMFSRWMVDAGLGNNIPAVHEDWATHMPDLPVVIKAASGSFGKGVHVIKSPEQWTKMIDIVVGIGKDFLVQDAIVSKDEYTHNPEWESNEGYIGQFAAINGRLLPEQVCFHVSMKESVFVKGKNDNVNHNQSDFQDCDTQPHHNEVGELLNAIVNRSCYNGFGCLQYKMSPVDNMVKVIELNPRVCGSLNSKINYFAKLIKSYVSELKAAAS